MTLTGNLGTRVELVSMDPHFRNITIGLYRQDHHGRPEYVVHSYSQLAGTRERIEFIRHAIKALGALERDGEWLYFGCGSAHQAAARRAFLEACKLSPASAALQRELTVLDKKSGRSVTAECLKPGVYRVTADGPDQDKAARIDGVANGLKKLGEMAPVNGSPDQVAFPCGHSHDRLIGLLLPRALNVRATLREDEAAVTRGLLVAPSQQNS